MSKKIKVEEEFCIEVESIRKDLKTYTSITGKSLLEDLILASTKELHHKKAITLLFVVRRSRLGPIQSQAVLKRPKWRASAKVAESPVMIIKSVFSL